MSDDSGPTRRPPRRTVMRTAAWTAPLAVVAVGAPAVAASPPGPGPAPNSEANYYWDVAADAPFLSVDPAADDLQFQVSAQVSYRADPWVDPPEGAALQIEIDLSQPAELESLGNEWEAGPGIGSTSDTFIFTVTPASFGGGLTAGFVGTAPGEIEVEGYMSVLNPGEASWAQEPAVDSGTLVA